MMSRSRRVVISDYLIKGSVVFFLAFLLTLPIPGLNVFHFSVFAVMLTTGLLLRYSRLESASRTSAKLKKMPSTSSRWVRRWRSTRLLRLTRHLEPYKCRGMYDTVIVFGDVSARHWNWMLSRYIPYGECSMVNPDKPTLIMEAFTNPLTSSRNRVRIAEAMINHHELQTGVYRSRIGKYCLCTNRLTDYAIAGGVIARHPDEFPENVASNVIMFNVNC